MSLIVPSLHIESSATIRMNTLALEKKRAGKRIYNLSAGEPMVDTPEVIKRAALEALEQNYTHYPPAAGILELRESACAWMNENFDSSYTVDETLISVGGKMGLYMLLQSFISTNDEVVFAAPYWVSYPSMVKIFGGIPRIIETEENNDWKIQPHDLEQIITSKTKILILNNASNPTGVLYTAEELYDILSIAQKYNLLVISDEVYSGLVYDGKTYVSCASFQEFKDVVVVIQSCSKSFAMTGWRVGFVFGSKQIIGVLTSLSGQSTSGVTTIAQYAAVAALKNASDIIPKICIEMQKRRDIFIDTFNTQFNVLLKKPLSALYVFIPISVFGSDNRDSLAFCEEVLDTIGVALVPGISFGKEGYVRVAFGAEEQELKEAVNVLAKYFIH